VAVVRSLEDEELYSGYADEQRQHTLWTGRVAAALTLLLVPPYAFFDLAVLQSTSFWPMRVVPITLSALFLILAATSFRRHPRWIIPAHVFQLTGLMVMATGISFVAYLQRSVAGYPAGAVSVVFDLILAAFLLAAGARPWLPVILFGPLAFWYLGLWSLGTLDATEWAPLWDPLVASVAAVVAAELQQRVARKEYAARVRAEKREREAERHLAALQELNERLGREVEERRAVEERLAREAEEHRATADRLARSNRDLQAFAYSVSHDLKEPLRSVIAFQGLLRERLAELGVRDADLDDSLGRACGGAERLGRIVDDMLSYGRVDSQGRDFETVDLNEVVETVRLDLAASIQAAGATIRADHLPRVLADRRQMELLFQNLLSNAIKFHPADRAPVIQLRTSAEHGLARVDVIDNGIGIDRQYFERIFELFQRLHGRADYEGTGIGLALCKRIVERHGGRIGVESSPGLGSTFWIALPSAGSAVAEAGVPSG